MTIRILLADVMEIFESQVQAGVLRDPGLLDGAVSAPFQIVFDRDLYPTLAQKAGKLLEGIQRVQAYSDGNKRLAWLTTVSFLQWNGQILIDVDQPEVDLFVRSLVDLENPEIAAALWLNERMVSLA